MEEPGVWTVLYRYRSSKKGTRTCSRAAPGLFSGVALLWDHAQRATRTPPTKKLCLARKDLDFLTICLGFSDDVGVFLPGFLGSRRLWEDSGKVRGGPGSRGKVWERS